MKKFKALIEGPVLSTSGYGEHARLILRALRTQPERFEVFVLPTNWGGTSWQFEDSEERKFIDDRSLETFKYVQKPNREPFDLFIHVGILNEFTQKGLTNVSVTAGIETTKVSKLWVEKSRFADKIIVPSNFAKFGFENTEYEGMRCIKPIEVIPYPMKTTEPVVPDLKFRAKFNFLVFAQWGVRKNVENTIRWFTEEFYDNKDVGMVLILSIKDHSTIDKEQTKDRVEGILNSISERECPVELIHGDLTEGEILGLMTHPQVKAMLSLSHGEGFSLPMFDAATVGLPIVTVDWSGPTDFLYIEEKEKKPHAYFARVKYSLKPIQQEAVWENILIPESMWAFPDPGSAKMQMRKIVKQYDVYKSRAKALSEHIHENYTQERIYKQITDSMLALIDIDIDSWLKDMNVSFNTPQNIK